MPENLHTNFNYGKKSHTVPVVFFSLYILSSFAHATEFQIAGTDDLLNLSLEDLFAVPVTSASYFPETPLDVAASVSVIPHQDWEKRGAQRLHDAFQHLPSVASLPNFLGVSSLRIRGYALSDARGVGTLWDGIPINTFNFSSSDVERPNLQLNTLHSIELTRGPGSVLYGSDAFHGVLALNSFTSEENTNLIMGRLGSTGFYSTGYNGSVGIGKSSRMTMSLASSGQPDQDIEYSHPTGTSDRDYNYQSSTFVSKFASSLTNNWSYKLGFYYDDNDSNDFHGQWSVPQIDVASVESDLKMLKADMIYRISDHSDLSLKLYGWETKRKFERPVSATNNIIITGEETRNSAQLLYRNNQLRVQLKDVAIDTELSVAMESRNDKIVDQHRVIFNSSTILVDADLPFSGVTRDIDSITFDGKTQIQNVPLIFRYGFRLDDYSDFGSQFTPRMGLIYQIQNDTVLKALYGQSFRAANAFEVGGTPFISGDPNINPEELDTYELVFLKQTKDSRYEITLFYNELTNGITNDGSQYFNLTQSDSRGIELGYSDEISDFIIESSASYVDSRDKTNSQDFHAFPTYIFNLGVGYDFGANWVLYVNNRVMLDYKENVTTNADDLKDYWRVDINLRKTYEDVFQIYANLRNALNRDNVLPHLVSVEGGVPEDEISLDLGVTYKF